MRSLQFILISFFTFSVAALPVVGHAKSPKMPEVKIVKEEGPVDIEADHLIYDRQEKLYQAHGKVEVTRGDFSLKADHAQLSTVTNEMIAWGNVILTEGEDVLECERLEVNLDSRMGRVFQGKLFLKDQNFHIAGQEAEKLGENQYRIRQGSFTTCDATRPPWKFTMRELDVNLTGSGIAKAAVFYIEDIPVLYLPTAIFPVRQERQTGFLSPEVGNSSTYGPQVRTAFYWAISKDMDATLFLDRLGDSRGRGFKEGLEYRYAFANDTKGQANFNFIDDRVYDGNRYSFFLQHDQKLPSGFYLKGDINLVSDRFYPADFYRDFWGVKHWDEFSTEKMPIDSTSLKQLRSVLFGGKNWDKFSFLAEGAVFNDLSKSNNDETVQKLPQVSFYAHPQPLSKTPFFYDLTSSYTYFWREKDVEAHRWDLFPEIFYPTRLFDVLKVESNLGLRETSYRTQRDPTGELNGWKSRETFQAGVQMSTEFYRVYDGSQISRLSNLFKVAKWMHTIEPTVGYQYNPPVNQDKLPFFDDVDRIPFTSQITYGVTQRLIGKPQKEDVDSGPYEYARLRISQSYSLGEPFQGDESKGKFSNVQGELWLNLNPYLNGRARAEFNPYRGDFDILDGLIKAKDQRNDAFQVEYRYTKDKIKGFNFLTRVKTIEPLYIYGAIWYNLLDKTWVESIYGVEFQSQCWMVGLMVTDKNRSPDGTQKKEVTFQVYFNLLGMGAVGHKPRLTKL